MGKRSEREGASGYTPGPWYIDKRDDEPLEVRAANQALVAYVVGRASHVRLDPAANARLIATAPELVRFAQLIAVWAIAPDLSAENAAELGRQARALLARIEGRE